jgi:hypothetical protein
MNAKTTKVALQCAALGERLFEISHAERLLSMRNNGGWELANNSEYEYKNGAINRRHTEKRKRAKEKVGD